MPNFGNPDFFTSDVNTVDVRKNLRTPLLWSVGRGDLDIVEELLEDPRTIVNWPNLSGSTPLFELCFCISHAKSDRIDLQILAKVGASGLVNFITAVTYHFCLNLPAAFTQPGAPTLADLCTLKNVVH